LKHAKKRFGQHFLHDPGTIDRIVRAIAPAAGDRLVEIGPGRGAITLPVGRCRGRGELRVHEADALEFDFRAMRGSGAPLRLVGNLPYNISTPLLFHFVSQLDAFQDMHFMLQKEVVARMAARPGSKQYGRLTVMLAPSVRVEPLFDIGTGAFSPPPKVVSTFFALRPHAAPPFVIRSREAYARVVAAAFSQRRKTLRNALAGLLDPAGIAAAGVDPTARAETLAPAQFADLAARLPGIAGQDDHAGSPRPGAL
jgi:16S rRNA (adenine1518-N6/adenine1519-N6)-dimethyltransferase